MTPIWLPVMCHGNPLTRVVRTPVLLEPGPARNLRVGSEIPAVL